jgi:hypothetical protein
MKSDAAVASYYCHEGDTRCAARRAPDMTRTTGKMRVPIDKTTSRVFATAGVTVSTFGCLASPSRALYTHWNDATPSTARNSTDAACALRLGHERSVSTLQAREREPQNFRVARGIIRLFAFHSVVTRAGCERGEIHTVEMGTSMVILSILVDVSIEMAFRLDNFIGVICERVY